MRLRLFSLVLVCVAIAGCTGVVMPDVDVDDPTNGGSSDDDDNSPDRTLPEGAGLEVQQFSCTVDGTPCGEADVTEFSIPQLSLSVVNTGEADIDVTVGEGSGKGRGLLVEKCDGYRIRDFEATVDSGSSTRGVARERKVSLAPGEELSATWFVELKDTVDVGNSSYACAFDAELTANQLLTTVKQLQVRGDETIPTASDLTYRTTAKAPVELVVESKDSIVQEELGGTIVPIEVRSYAVNRGGGEIVSMVHPRATTDIYVTMNSDGQKECLRKEFVQQSADGQVSTMGTICRFTIGRVETSQIFDVTAKARYTYELPLPPVEINVHPPVINE